LGLLPFANFGARLPVAALHRLELRALLRVITVVGVCTQFGIGNPREKADIADIVVGAAKALSEWPGNFHFMLQRLAGRNRQHAEGADFRVCFAPLYSALFKTKVTNSVDALDFMKEAFLDYAVNLCLAKIRSAL
jgi:hypothetical protein